MSDTIINKIDEMGNRIDELEKSLSELMTQAGGTTANTTPSGTSVIANTPNK